MFGLKQTSQSNLIKSRLMDRNLCMLGELISYMKDDLPKCSTRQCSVADFKFMDMVRYINYY